MRNNNSDCLLRLQIQSHMDKSGLLIPVHHTQGKPSQLFLTLHSNFAFFSHINTLTTILRTLESESIYPDETIRWASKWFILTQRMQNLECVNLKCATLIQNLYYRVLKPADLSTCFWPYVEHQTDGKTALVSNKSTSQQFLCCFRYL